MTDQRFFSVTNFLRDFRFCEVSVCNSLLSIISIKNLAECVISVQIGCKANKLY